MRIVLLHADTKQEIDADILESVTYVLHESFGDKARQGMTIFRNLIVDLTSSSSLQEATIPRV